MRGSEHPTGGFTVIELLVVMSIIILLIAMLLPALRKGRESARQAICQSHMRQYAHANELYADEHNDLYLPIRSADGGFWMWNDQYRELLGERVGDDDFELMRCPSIHPQAVGSGGLLHNSYGWNRTPHAWCDKGIFIRRHQVLTPSKTCQNIDGTDWHITSSYANYVVNWDVYRHTRLWAVAYRHDEGANIQHFDGHVSYYPKEEVWSIDDGAPYELWTTFARSDPCQ